jgi:uncharacterized protein YwqG
MDVINLAKQFLDWSEHRNYTSDILELIKPSILIKTHSEQGLGRSHFGGEPEIPPGFEMPTWDTAPYLRSELQYLQQNNRFNPDYQQTAIANIQKLLEENTIYPLTYLGQIFLEELPELGGIIHLPRTGILYFFYDLYNSPPGSRSSSRGGWRSIYVNTPPNRVENVTEYGDTQEWFPHCSLTFTPRWMFCVPEHKVNQLDHISDPELLIVRRELHDRFSIQTNWGGYSGEHRILGYPSTIQNEMERMCQLRFHGIDEDGEQLEEIESGVDDWQLLVQFDSDDNVNWQFGDSGKLFFWIRKQDLEQQDFSNVWFDFQSC